MIVDVILSALKRLDEKVLHSFASHTHTHMEKNKYYNPSKDRLTARCFLAPNVTAYVALKTLKHTLPPGKCCIRMVACEMIITMMIISIMSLTLYGNDD